MLLINVTLLSYAVKGFNNLFDKLFHICNRHMLLCKRKVTGIRIVWGFIDGYAFLGKMQVKSYRSHKTSACVGSTEGDM